MKLKRHGAAELERFLVAIDDALNAAASIVVIGGSALALGYGVAAATSDIDTYGSRLGTIEVAARRARILTRLDIPIANSTIARLPAGYETRLRRVMPRLRQLAVWVVEAHDLAASKLLRGNEHDRQQLKLRVTDTVSLDIGTLRDFQLTVHHRAGHPPIVETASFESVVRDLGATITAYQSLSWRARLAPGTAVRLRVRTADTVDELAIEPWSDPIVDPDAGAPPVPARRFFQYRIELDSDGDGTAMVDWVRLDYAEEIP